MINLNDIFNINLKTSSFFDLKEDDLIKLKSEDYYTQSNFYFWSINKLNLLSQDNDIEELAYGHYLLSYYLLIIFTPLYNEELSFNYCKKALSLSTNIKYKEWFLIFWGNPKGFVSAELAYSIAEEVQKANPHSELANMIIMSSF